MVDRRGAVEAGLEQVEVVAPDRELVAVAQGAPLDEFAVEDDAVEAAVVEDAQVLALLPDDQGVAAGDGRVVEADVGHGAAADPSPAQLEPERLDRVVAEHQVAARLGDRLAGLGEPGHLTGRAGRGELDGGRTGLRGRVEHRCAFEAGAPAAGAVGEVVELFQGDVSLATGAGVCACAGLCAGFVHLGQCAGEDWGLLPGRLLDASAGLPDLALHVQDFWTRTSQTAQKRETGGLYEVVRSGPGGGPLRPIRVPAPPPPPAPARRAWDRRARRWRRRPPSGCARGGRLPSAWARGFSAQRSQTSDSRRPSTLTVTVSPTSGVRAQTEQGAKSSIALCFGGARELPSANRIRRRWAR